LNRLLFNTFRNGLGAQCYAEFIYLDNMSLQTLANILPDTANIWWRRPDGPHSSVVASRDYIIHTSFRESLRILALTFGRDIRQWQWGRLHTLTFRHPFDKASKLIARLVDIPAGAMPGGPTTVLQGTYYLWNPYEMQIGPSMRMVTDMKEPVLYGVLPTGNSEAIFGDHYKDMLPLYQTGALVRVSLTEHNPNWKRFELRPN
ncbi:MAG TPA: penicillin acylase family protein, partial [Candidatus Kapabacteria bacterium]|nr:penicillin acylase family protein [Candidatus Kapabacteria bacterium]